MDEVQVSEEVQVAPVETEIQEVAQEQQQQMIETPGIGKSLTELKKS